MGKWKEKRFLYKKTKKKQRKETIYYIIDTCPCIFNQSYNIMSLFPVYRE